MKLKQLTINRLPGIDQPFTMEFAGAGIQVIFGPNAIGKSSICRAVEALYWDDRGPNTQTLVKGQFEIDGKTWWAERDGSRLRWHCEDHDMLRPAIPPSRSNSCFFLRLRDLIDPSLDGTQDIASEIRRQMSGGFDLDGVAESRFPKGSKQYGRRERDKFNAAMRAVQDAEGNQAQLRRRADELGELVLKFKMASTNAKRLPFIDRAVGLASRMEERAEVERQIAALPGVLARLNGQESEQINNLQKRIGDLLERQHVFERKRDDGRKAKSESRLREAIDKSEIANWRMSSDELRRVELKLQSANENRAECRKELDAALSSLGRSDAIDVEFNVDDHGRLFEFLRGAEELRTQKSAIKWRLRLLADVEQAENGEEHLRNIREAVEVLRSWLRAPMPEKPKSRLWAMLLWIMLAAAIALFGLAMMFDADLNLVIVLAVGAGIMLPLALMRSKNPAENARAREEQAFAKLKMESPEEWDVGTVEARLRNLEAEVASIDAKARRARDRDVERRSLDSQRKELSEAESLFESQRKRLLESVKLDSMPQNAELVDTARALDRLREARVKFEGASGRVGYLEEKHAEIISKLANVLQEHGEHKPENAATAEVFLGNLTDRNAQFAEALATESSANDQLEQVLDDQKTALDSIQEIYAGANLENGDLTGLIALLDLLPSYRELRETAIRLQGQIELDSGELAKVDEEGLANCDKKTLERMKHDLLSSAREAEDFRENISSIKAEVREVEGGGKLQDLIGRRELAREELQNCRDQLLFNAAGKFLVSAVDLEYEKNQMPRVLDRAREHFSGFTHHAFELRLGRVSKTPLLFAVDTRNGESRQLDELSDGTRAQLLLASRIAFAEEVELGTRLPFFLDEALDQSDPTRFEAIVKSLAHIANDPGRQIFYLTSDPLDGFRIRGALEKEKCTVAEDIDLGLLRGETIGVTDPSMLQVPFKPVIPQPGRASTEEYGIALGVPLFEPLRGHSHQHFFYVLFDDLELLYELLVNGIEHAGQWKMVSGTALAEKLGARLKNKNEIELRLGLLEVFVEAWKQGRGKAVDCDALVISGAVSKVFLDAVAEIADELNGAPEKLLAAVKAKNHPKLKGFRQKSVDALERYLYDYDYLDNRPVLSESELKLRALASPQATNLAPEVARECLHRWWSWADNVSDRLNKT